MQFPRLPAEWEPQSGVLLTWPHPDNDWHEILPQAMDVFLRIAGHIAATQSLLSVCRDKTHLAQIRQSLMQRGTPAQHLYFAITDSNDTWARDHGPITTVLDGNAILNDFEFDGWGKKYPADKDNAITRTLHNIGCFGPAILQSHGWVLEGGALETDGHGTLLATRSSVLDPKRNPQLSPAQIEQRLREQLGIKRFLWLDAGSLSGDDTDAHIDVLARFCDPYNLVISHAPEGDADHPALADMAQQLAGFQAYDGQTLNIHPLPWPGIHQDAQGRRLPASYANFLIINQAVLVPTYGVAADQQALQILAERFPGRRVIGIDCRPLIAQNGSLHCVTMQFPQALTLERCHV